MMLRRCGNYSLMGLLPTSKMMKAVLRYILQRVMGSWLAHRPCWRLVPMQML